MDTTQPNIATRISFLWIAVLLAMLFRDIHQIAKPGYLAEIADIVVPEWLMLVAGIIISIPIVMIPLNQWLDGVRRRWANVVAVLLTLASAVSIERTDLDDWWFFGFETILLGVIVWLAWAKESSEPSI